MRDQRPADEGGETPPAKGLGPLVFAVVFGAVMFVVGTGIALVGGLFLLRFVLR
jgi:hypothetical protein